MKKLLIAAAILAATSMTAEARECLPGMDPIKDRCTITLDEEPAAPAWKQIPHEQLCDQYQTAAIELVKARDKGAGEEPLAMMLMANHRTDMIWIVRQVFWRQNAEASPMMVAVDVRRQCMRKDYPGAE